MPTNSSCRSHVIARDDPLDTLQEVGKVRDFLRGPRSAASLAVYVGKEC
jgi:hypothetical protein